MNGLKSLSEKVFGLLRLGVPFEHLGTPAHRRDTLPRRRTLQQPARPQDTVRDTVFSPSPARVTLPTPDVQIQFHCEMSAVRGELTKTVICHADSATQSASVGLVSGEPVEQQVG